MENREKKKIKRGRPEEERNYKPRGECMMGRREIRKTVNRGEKKEEKEKTARNERMSRK